MKPRIPIKRGSPPKRKTPLKKKRSTPRRGEPTAAEKDAVRRQVYARAQGRCERGLVEDCIKGILPWEGSVFERGHLAHIKSKGAGGKFTVENTLWLCWKCHLVGAHQKGKKL